MRSSSRKTLPMMSLASAQLRAAASVWVVNAYQLAITVALVPLSSLGDSLGYRRIFSLGLGLFTVSGFMGTRTFQYCTSLMITVCLLAYAITLTTHSPARTMAVPPR